MEAPQQAQSAELLATDGPGFRSSVVARMAGMPVATLRIWEQRYQAVRPAVTASGHRLYSPADVQRVLWLRQLTEQGHAISLLAALNLEQLQQVARQLAQRPAQQPAQASARQTAQPGLKRQARRWLVVGAGLAMRLQRPAVAQHWLPVMPRLTVVDWLDQAFDAVLAEAQVDLLLWHTPELPAELPPELFAAQQACCAQRVAVVYRYASNAAAQALVDAGCEVLREPADDGALGAWLAAVDAAMSRASTATSADQAWPGEVPGAVASASSMASPPLPPRRFDEASLTTIAGRSPNLACECPRHVAELLMQLSSFEAYSANCLQRSPDDAGLHAYLQQVAGVSRMLFESALERVARHEGLKLS